MKTNIKFFKEVSNSDDCEYISESYLVFPVIPNVGTEIYIQGQNFCVTYVKILYEREYCEAHVFVEELDV